MIKNIDNDKLKKDIQRGIDMGVELSKDDGIEFKIEECQTNNGNSNKIDIYRNQIQNNSIDKNNQTIINNYKQL